MTNVVTGGYALLVGEIDEDGIRDRVRWLVENRANGNARELARRAKLASETHVGLILERGGERTAGTILAKNGRHRVHSCLRTTSDATACFSQTVSSSRSFAKARVGGLAEGLVKRL